jgi:O-antigen ligase
MRSLAWTASIWTVCLAAIWVLRRRSGHSLHWSREQLALILVLLGSFTIAPPATTNEVLADPLVIERVVRAALIGLAALVVLPSLLRNARSSRLRGGSGLTLLWLYLLTAALSTIYSVAPIVTGPKVVELATGILIITSLYLSPNPKSNLKNAVSLVVMLELALTVAAVIGFFVVPHVFAPLEYRRGFFLATTLGAPWWSSNSLSAAGSVVAAYSLAKYFESIGVGRLKWIAGFTVGTVATVLASGRQGVAMWVVGVAILLFVHRRRLFLWLIGPAALGLVLMNWDVIFNVLSKGQPESSLLELTGRLQYWQSSIAAFSLHPWTGYGFGAGGRFVALSAIGEGTRSNVHNGYLEALMGVGIVGFVPLFMSLLIALAWSARQLARKIDTALAILIIPLVIHTSLDIGFGAWLKPDFLILAGILVISDLERTPREVTESRKMIPVATQIRDG